MSDGAEVSVDDATRPTEVDQVAAARDWMRSHGIEPPPETQPAPAGGIRSGQSSERGESDETGYSRSRRAPAAGTTGWPVPGRRTRGPASDPDAEVDADGRAGAPGKAAGPDADPKDTARDIVLRKLAVQARTRVELERALAEREVPEEAAATVLDRMTEVGLIDDATFAHDWVASRQQRRSLSRTALRRELQTKGVDREVIDEALADVEGDDEHRAALDLARRRVPRMSGLSRDVAYRRLGGVLARRGFSSSITTRVLSEVLEGFPRDE